MYMYPYLHVWVFLCAVCMWMCTCVLCTYVCMCVQHLALTLSPTKRVVHGGGYQQCKSLSVIMGGLMTHCHHFDAQLHIASAFLLLWEEVKAQIIKERKENRTRLLTIHNRLRGDEGIWEMKRREKDGEMARERELEGWRTDDKECLL